MLVLIIITINCSVHIEEKEIHFNNLISCDMFALGTLNELNVVDNVYKTHSRISSTLIKLRQEIMKENENTLNIKLEE